MIDLDITQMTKERITTWLIVFFTISIGLTYATLDYMKSIVTMGGLTGIGIWIGYGVLAYVLWITITHIVLKCDVFETRGEFTMILMCVMLGPVSVYFTLFTIGAFYVPLYFKRRSLRRTIKSV